MSTQEALFVLAGSPGADVAPADPFTAAVPAWLADRLEGINPERRGPFAKLVPCPRCASPVLHAADAGLDLMTDSTVDPNLLTAEAEVLALLAGRYTVEADVLGYGRGIMLFRRDRWNIATPPAARKRYALPEHRCGPTVGVPLPYQMLYPHLYAQIHNPKDHDNDPPF